MASDAQHEWRCGCGWVNGSNLARCAQCNRTPLESLATVLAASLPAAPTGGEKIEVRYATLDDGTSEFDEIVATNAYVHLEKMDKSQFALIVEAGGERGCWFIGAKRAPVDCFESWRDRVAPPLRETE